MNPERMKEIEGRLDGGDEHDYRTDVADLLKELGAYQHLILNILSNLDDLEKCTPGQQTFSLKQIKGILTTAAEAHDFAENKFRQPAGHKCEVSNGICGSLTFGTGELDDYGYWEFSCLKCAKAWKEQYSEETWPREIKNV